MASSSSNRKPSPWASLAPAFYILNWLAFCGWTYVLYILVQLLSEKDTDAITTTIQRNLTPILLALEGICIIEVARIFVGDLPGSLALGVILHVIRWTAILQVLPRCLAMTTTTITTDDGDVSNNDSNNTTLIPLAVLWSWAVTEVTRYPMYLFPSNALARSIRLVTPLLTFPVGAFAEGYGAFSVFTSDTHKPYWLKFLLIVMLLVNGVLGPGMAYPHIFWKAAPVLGLIQKKDRKDSKEDEAGSGKSNKPKAKIKAV